MATLYQDQQPPQIQDLKVSVYETFIVKPAEPTPRRSMFLSNIDQLCNFDVHTIHFFGAHPDHPTDVVVRKLQDALSRVLVHYDFLAGRLGVDPAGSGRLVLDCNSAGLWLVVASIEYRMDDVGDLVYPNPAFKQLFTRSISPDNNKPLAIFQVTSFECGGFAIGIRNNHATFDGLSFKMFLDNLGALAAGKPLLFEPCNDRKLLAARSPPSVTFPHPELMKLDDLPGGRPDSGASKFGNTTEHLDFKIFRLTYDDIARLKRQAEDGGTKSASRLNTVTAHIWRCKALSVGPGESGDDERMSTMMYAVDIRPRLSPPLPRCYAGNAVMTAYATATCKDLREGPLSRLVDMVKEGSARMTDKYVRSTIDWLELYKGFPNWEFLVSSWWQLGLADVEYPWGQPRYSCPLVHQRKHIISLFPATGNDSVNVWVALPTDEMTRFQAVFCKFLEQSA